MVMDNVKRVPRDFVGLGRTLGLSETRILLRIVLPSALPGNLGHAADQPRLGLDLAGARRARRRHLRASATASPCRSAIFQTETIIGYILFLGILGLATDQGMKALERVLFRYSEAR